jgi:alpha-beta hydrolase superfamily lysophospholipase
MKVKVTHKVFLLALLLSAIGMYFGTYAHLASAATSYNTVEINGVNVFYREAGDKNAPTLLLLHGFPTSSHMYRNLMRELSDSYHLLALDYPGFGYSDQPSMEDYEYTFDNLAGLLI